MKIYLQDARIVSTYVCVETKQVTRISMDAAAATIYFLLQGTVDVGVPIRLLLTHP